VIRQESRSLTDARAARKPHAYHGRDPLAAPCRESLHKNCSNPVARPAARPGPCRAGPYHTTIPMPESLARPPLALIGSGQEWPARSLDSILAPAGFSVIHARSTEEVLEQVRSARPDVVLLDLHLADAGGVEVCRLLRTRNLLDPTAPIIITAQEPLTRELRMQALRAGAWECFAFPVDAQEMLLKLRVFLDAKFEADSLRDATLLDPFTGFYSARGLLRRARELGADADRHSRALGCVVMAPDAQAAAPHAPAAEPSPELLRHLARVLELHGRSSDSIGRLSHMDFVVLAPDTDREGVLRLAHRLAEAARRSALAAARQSIGIRAGCYAVDDFALHRLEPVELMVRATLALRRAQAEPGGSPIRFFQPGHAAG
jgi:PleD family two-component response regulator